MLPTLRTESMTLGTQTLVNTLIVLVIVGLATVVILVKMTDLYQTAEIAATQRFREVLALQYHQGHTEADEELRVEFLGILENLRDLVSQVDGLAKAAGESIGIDAAFKSLDVAQERMSHPLPGHRLPA